MKGTVCWETVGPALEIMQKLSPSIKKLLEDNQELLEQGEDRPRVVAFNMLMEGSKPSSAQPIIVFSSKSRRQRTYAKALLKQSGLLAEYPSIQLRTLDKMPAVYQAADEGQSSDVAEKDDKNVYIFDQSNADCGALISFGSSKLATLTAVFRIGFRWYGLSAQHARFKYPQEPRSPTTTDEVLAFDDDSDYENGDIAVATSKGKLTRPRSFHSPLTVWPQASISTASPVGADTTPPQSSEDDSIFDKPCSAPITIPMEITPMLQGTEPPNTLTDNGTQVLGDRGQRRTIGTMLRNSGVTDLDYEVFVLKDQSYRLRNRIFLPDTVYEPARAYYPSEVANEVSEGPIVALTGPTGIVKGIIMRNSRYIRMQLATTYQEMWTVQLDRNTSK